MYYHVRISQKATKAHDETKLDLSEEQVLNQIMQPYESGEPIIINGKAIPISDLERVRISRSDSPSSVLIEQVKSEERASKVLVVGGPSYEWQAAARANDITDEFIKSAPGVRKPSKMTKASASKSNDVFIVHGHDDALKNDLEVFLRRLHLNPIVLHREPDEGLTIIEKFERHSSVSFAFILLTPDDIGYNAIKLDKTVPTPSMEPRARQNAIFEFGYFLGKLGRANVCCIYKEGVVLPSDVSGLLYKKISNSVEEIGFHLIKELQTAGLHPSL